MRRMVLGTAIAASLLGVVYLVEATRYARGTMAEPGPGLFPLGIGALLLSAALATGLEAWSRRTWEDIDWPRGRDALRVLAVLALGLSYALLLPWLGHPVAASLITLAVLQLMRLQGWALKLGLALGLGLGSYYLFAVVLGVPLPTGLWFE